MAVSLPAGLLVFFGLCPAPISKYLRLLYQCPPYLPTMTLQCLNQFRIRQSHYMVYQMTSITGETQTINNDQSSTKIIMFGEDRINQTL